MASWSEDSFRGILFSSVPTIYSHTLDDAFPRQPLNADTQEFERLCCILVENYSARLFRNEEDYLHGFTGILKIFRKLCNEPFVWGLPESLFSSALTRPCATSPSSAKRRVGLHSFHKVDGTTTTCRFPSWSWVGWACEVYLAQCSDELQPNATGLKFYSVDEKGQLSLIQERKATFEGDAPVPRPWKGMESCVPVTENIPQGFLYTPQSQAALCFWSSVAILRAPRRSRIPIPAKCLWEQRSRVCNSLEAVTIQPFSNFQQIRRCRGWRHRYLGW